MPIEIHKLETLYQGYSTLMMATLAAPDGTTFKREIEHHGHAAAVLAYDPARRTALMVSQPRAPVIWADGPPELLEAIAGMLDGEDPQVCVRREAMEEAGVTLGEVEPLGVAFPSPGVSSERMHLFLAAYSLRDRVADGGGVDGEDENITVMEIPLAQLWAQVEAQEIQDLKTLTLILALRVRRPELFA
ncbi:NUDIX domain-containing protein [Phenylobacterium sp. LjRoot225]|uniref:NUDIX domain-containing protein n=1 Tax=Phenylobacterium sp. LjRoot225 TaxID=3342285 RepID=UPI003ED08BA6